ncbi:hypothetical protein IFT64_12020 [Oxalobacteraceae sp. CFBP 8753]|nr:hypothetical protein [Oxalobacteraceae sp. CFBP 8753]
MSVTVARSPIAGLDTAGKTSLGSMVTPGWYIAFYLHVTSDNATNEIQTIFSSGALVAGAFNLGFGGPGHPDANTIHCTLGSSTTRYKAPVGSFPLGWKGYVVAQRAPAGNLSLYWVPVQATAPIDDSAVQSALNLVSTTSQLTQLTRTQVALGMRGDAVRGCDQTIGRAVMGSGNLTKLEMARLAFGEEITDLGKTPLVYARLDTPTDITDRGSDANMFTQTGAFTQGPAPGWGYVPPVPSAPVFTSAPVIDGAPVVGSTVTFTRGAAAGYPTPTRTQQWYLDGAPVQGATELGFTLLEADLDKPLTVRDFAENASGKVGSTSAPRTVTAQASGVNAVAEITQKVIQRLPLRTGTSAPVVLSGTYDGTAVAADVLLWAEDGTTVSQNWTPITDATFANQVWSGSAPAKTGGPYRHQVRFKDTGGNIIGMTPIAVGTWNVGVLMAIGGSSGGEGIVTTGTFPANSNVFKFRFNVWSGMGGTSNGPMCLMANALADRLGMPVGVIAYAASGSTLEEWSRGDSVFTAFKNAVVKCGGAFEALVFTGGSNDANEGGVDSYAVHLFRVERLYQMMRDQFGGQDMPALHLGFNRRATANPTQSDMVREVENTISGYPNITLVQTLDLEWQSDLTHLTGAGYGTSIRRGIFQCPYISGSTEKNGPRITAFEHSGSAVIATIAHGSGTDFVPSAGASGFTVSDANGVRTIVSVERIDATHLRITCDQALVAPVVTKHLSGAAPIVTAPILDNSTVPLPLAVQTKLATTAGTESPAPDTTAPVMIGEIEITNVTMSGATLSCPSATDAVGVAGYEYSINGGEDYSVIANAARSVVVSGRPAGMLHEVRMRAFDAAGNRSKQPLAKSFTTLSTQPAQNAVVASTVAESRRVAFPGGTRVVAFGSVPSAVTPNAPYLEASKWWSEKHPLDERYWVADITIDLAERKTTAAEVEAIVAGVTVLQLPVIQGKLIPVKLGGFNAATAAVNFCTFRVKCANGERFDRTIWFKQQVGSWSLEKDADDESYFVADIGNDLVDSNTTASQVKALPVGVVELVPAVIQGPLILVKLGGMDTLPAGVNYCDLRIDCANSERFYRTIQFNKVDN